MTRTRVLGRGQFSVAWSALVATCVAVTAQSPPAIALPTLLPDMLSPLPVHHGHKPSPVPQEPASLPVPQGASTGPPVGQSSADGSNSALVFVLVAVGEFLESSFAPFTGAYVPSACMSDLACSVETNSV